MTDYSPSSEICPSSMQSELEEVIDQVLLRATTHAQAGEFEEAMSLYQAVLRIQPEHPIACQHLALLELQALRVSLGLVYFQMDAEHSLENAKHWLALIDALMCGEQSSLVMDVVTLAAQLRLDSGVVRLLEERARSPLAQGVRDGLLTSYPEEKLMEIKTKAKLGDASASLDEVDVIVSLYSQGQYQETEALARSLIYRCPDNGFAWKVLGAVLQMQGQVEQAVLAMQKALDFLPNDAEAYSNLGMVLQGQAKLAESEPYLRHAILLKPDYAEAHANLGLTLHNLGRYAEAEACLRMALTIKPDFVQAHSNLAFNLQQQGRITEAEHSMRRAQLLEPDSAIGCFNLANILRQQGNLESTEMYLYQSLKLKPDFAKAHNNLGCLYKNQGRLSESETSHRKAIYHDPENALLHNNLGVVLNEVGKLREAEVSLRNALRIDPDLAEAHNNLALVCEGLGLFSDANKAYLRALELRDKFALAHSNLLFFLSHDEHIDANSLFLEHCRFGEKFELSLQEGLTEHVNLPDPDRSLRIGFVSGDFRNHAVSYFFEPVLAKLATDQDLVLHAYYNCNVNDDVTKRLRDKFRYWNSVAELSDADVEKNIRADGIDILIDLSGHTAYNRLPLFARKPAPIQLSWIGYPGTTGLQSMDYILTDRYFSPEGEFDHLYTEKIVRLPASAPFMPFPDAPEVNALPALSNCYITFGSFNRASKITKAVIEVWARLLRSAPSSKLIIGAMPKNANFKYIEDIFLMNGVARERISFFERCDMPEYLNKLRNIDICLDTFPYNGGTTTWHSLWMGIPTITKIGATSASRSGICILSHVALQRFAVKTEGEYVAEGVYWSENLSELANLRGDLRNRMRNSATLNPTLIADSVRSALRLMWQKWCAGLAPVSFSVALPKTKAENGDVDE